MAEVHHVEFEACASPIGENIFDASCRTNERARTNHQLPTFLSHRPWRKMSRSVLGMVLYRGFGAAAAAATANRHVNENRDHNMARGIHHEHLEDGEVDRISEQQHC